MSENPSQSSPNSSPRTHVHWVRIVCIGIGILAILVGLADVTSRFATDFLGADAARTIFAPPAAAPGALLAPSVALASTTPFTPARLLVPSIGVSANVEQVGKKQDGSMATPTDFGDVGFYALGSRPGANGNAVFAGHVNNALTKSGVFAHLAQIHLGDYVTVEDTNGHALVYKVKSINLYPADTAPEASVFATAGPSQLVLITCDGEWVKDEHQFDKRLVVVASPAY